MDRQLLFRFSVVLLCLGYQECNGAQTCGLTNYFDTNLMERFVQADIVLYGMTSNHVAHKVYIDDKFQYVIDAIFDVYCVIRRKEDQIAERITISGIAPRDRCSGTDATENMKVGDHSIVALKNVSGEFVFHEVMPKTTAVAPAMKPYLLSLARVCDLQNWQPPFQVATNKCPICGTADFDSGVHAMFSYSNMKNCIYETYAIAENITECDLYLAHTMDEANSLTCVPSVYQDTCVMLMPRPLTATCDCSEKQVTKDVGVGGGTVLLPSVLLMLASLLYINIQ